MDENIPPLTSRAASVPGAGPPVPGSGPEPPGRAVPSRPRLFLDRPREVLAWLPYQLHFWPHESVVLASVREPETEAPAESSGLGLVARTDLSIIGNSVGGRQAQVEMSRHLQRDGAAQVLCAIYTEQAFATVLRGEGPAGRTLTWWRSTPWADLGRSYLVGPERFRCVECAAEPCCPHTGQPLEVLRNTQVAAWHVYHGHRYAERRDALVPDHQAAASTREAAAAAARHHLDRRPTRAGTQLVAWQQEMAGRWATLVQTCDPATADHLCLPGENDREPSPAETGAVLAGMSDTWVRDAVLLWSGTGQLLGERVRADVTEAVFSGRLRPQAARVRAAERALAVLSAHASDRWRPPVLTCQSWLAWWTGDGARANILLHRALQTDPDYALARLLGTALAHGIPPGWVRPAPRAS
ncbi:DUF4192 domain-containing protein [Ruania albidiflava]|uniref:DUF4192 domain-containing protein n=1 Tax=Ruania albidiflava TaxID=366586 RepID=UPI00146F5295|nr:DUF4192 domain-containing protein [Ruania albidiflava]